MNYLIQSINDTFNFLTVLNGKLYWAGFPIDELKKTEIVRNRHEYYLISKGWILGKIHLSDENYKECQKYIKTI